MSTLRELCVGAPEGRPDDTGRPDDAVYTHFIALRIVDKGVSKTRWLSGSGVGLLIRRLLVRFPAVKNDVVSLGKALHPTCLGGISLYLL